MTNSNEIGIKKTGEELRFILVFSLAIDERPHIHAFQFKEDRDSKYDEYISQGTLTLVDYSLGVTQLFQPIYVIKFDYVDGAVSEKRIDEVFDVIFNLNLEKELTKNK